MSNIVLTDGQQTAYNAFSQFILHPTEKFFVLAGYAGTGKSTLVTKLLGDLPKVLHTLELLTQKTNQKEIVLTATTNKACEALESITNRPVETIHSFLGLRVQKNYKSGVTELVATNRSYEHSNQIIFIDEASYIDSWLLKFIEKFTDSKCKVIFIGDPAQLRAVKASNTPVFSKYKNGAALDEVVRQAKGNPIIEAATMFRNVVNGDDWGQFDVDGHHIKHLDRPSFEAEILKEFDRKDWHHNDSKILAYTNKTVIQYNRAVSNHVQGTPELEVGDYAICNSFISNKNCNIKTDQTVLITGKKADKELGIPGWQITVNSKDIAFMPERREDRNFLIKEAKENGDYSRISYIDNYWIDLRASYACTINKSQGSTYDKVFIDLDDLRICKNNNTLARLMYVAVSRARSQVIMTGDLV